MDLLPFARDAFGGIVAAELEEREDIVFKLADAGPIPAESILVFIEELALSRLETLSCRIAVSDFHHHRLELGLPADPSSRVAWDSYLRRMAEGRGELLMSRYPRLSGLARAVVSNVAEHAVEVVERVNGDLGLLAAEDLTTDAPLRMFDLGGDPHRGGRSAVLLATEDDQHRIVYKPRSGAPEVGADRLLCRLGKELRRSLDRMVPRTIEAAISYSWQEWVSSSPATQLADIEDFYYRFGAAAALFGAVGATDIHHENVLAASDRPVFVDLETTLRGDNESDPNNPISALRDSIKFSSCNTLIIPQRVAHGPYSIIMSGLGVPYEQMSKRTDFVSVEVESDAYDLARRSFDFRHVDNVLHGPSGPTSILDFHEAFLQGMRDGYAGIRSARKDLIEIAAWPVNYRMIPRATAVYGRFLQAAWDPTRLASADGDQKLFAKLGTPHGIGHPMAAKFVASSEVAQLTNGDVPYFEIPSQDIRVRDHAGRLSSPIVDFSPAERAQRGLERVHADTVLSEEVLVDRGLAELRRLPNATWATGPQQTTVFDRLAKDRRLLVPELYQSLVALGTHTRKEVVWATGASPETLGTFDSGVACSLHDYGVTIPLRRFAQSEANSDPEARNTATRAERGLERLARYYREVLDEAATSIISGSLSIPYSMLLAQDGVPALRRTLASTPLTAESDFIVGSPAALLLASALDATTLEDRDRSLTEVDALPLNSIGPEDELAHGKIGIEWTRYWLRHASDPDSAAEELAAYLSRLPTKCGLSWCKGLAGRAVAAADVLDAMEERLIQQFVERLARVPAGPVDLSVCHGVSGQAQALAALAQAGVRGARDAAREVMDEARRAMARWGYFTGAPADRSMLGYFLGWSGFLDTLLIVEGIDHPHRQWVPSAVSTARFLVQERS